MDPVLKAYAISVVVLYFKTFATSLVQAASRFSSKTFVNPEDARAFGGVAPAAQDADGALRGAAVWRNDVENLPLFMFLGLVYYLVEASPSAAPTYFYTYVAARIVHSIVFFLGLQPWRFLAFLLGQLCMIGMAVQILMIAM
ncbi:MAG: glutathione S-transferase [Hyphomicrobiaceae bacterium]|jgi:glutathione S-transferase